MCDTIPGRSGDNHDRFAEAVAFHGHICPGLATGYRAAAVALERLRSGRSEDEELVVITETDACGVDAIQVITGCTVGKGNLFFKDHGKHAFTFINRKTGEAVRVASVIHAIGPCIGASHHACAAWACCASASIHIACQPVWKACSFSLTISTDSR